MGLIKRTIKFFAMRGVETAMVMALVVLMPSLPPYGNFTSYNVVPPRPLEGPLSTNKLLEKAEKLFENQITGPEAFADYDNELYTGLLSGKVVKITRNGELQEVVSFSKPNCKGIYTESDCGRPLGLTFDQNGNLYVIDTYSGIWKVNVKTSKKELLVSVKDKIDGKTISLPNDLTIASNGDLYWTDSSTDHQLVDIMYSILSDGSGRLFKYSAKTKKNEVLIDNMYFANGVELSENEDFVLVSELLKARIIRYYLKGPKQGTHDIFVDGLPGTPDNITPNKRGGFLVGCIASMDQQHPNLLIAISPFWILRKFVARIMAVTDWSLQKANEVYPHEYLQMAKHYVGNYKPLAFMEVNRATVIELDVNGQIIASYHSLNDSHIGHFSEAYIFDNYMYLGSPYNPYLARVKLSDLGIDKSKFKAQPKIQEKPPVKQTTPKATTTTPKPTTKPVTQKPTTTTPKPTTTTPKPTTTPPKPTTTPPKPTTTTPKPQTQKPTTPKTETQKPTPKSQTQKPSTTTPKPQTKVPPSKPQKNEL